MGACKSKDTVIITDPNASNGAQQQRKTQSARQTTNGHAATASPAKTKSSSSSSSSPYRLMYFPIRGRCEHIRLIFAAGGIEVNDVRVPSSDWPELKPKTPMGFMPVLEVTKPGQEKLVLTQNMAVARYAAREAKLVPENLEDAALADSIVDSVIDLREGSMVPIVFEKDPDVKNAKFDTFIKETLPTRLKQLEAVLGNQEFFVSNKVCWADIIVFAIFEMSINADKRVADVINSNKKIMAHYNRVAKLPRIAKYLKGDRAAVDRPIFKDDEGKKTYKLQYFPARARAEHIRMLFAVGGVAFEDVHIAQKDWPALKPKTPMGFLPTLEINGKDVITQNSTVARFVARECKLVPENPFDAALADSLVDSALDLREEGLVPLVFGKEDEKVAKFDKFVKETLPTRLEQFENILGGKDYFVNNKLSWADVEIFCVLEQLKNAHAQLDSVINTFSKIAAHFKRVAKLPNMAKFLNADRAALMLKVNLPDAKAKRSFKLTYFGVRARAEHIRMIFAAGGVDMEENRITKEQWPALKPKTPMGFLPTLEIDGKEVITQNKTIARFAARESGLMPENDFDAALADSVVDSALDLREDHMVDLIFGKEENRPALMEKMVNEILPNRLKQLENVLGKKDFFVNNKVSWADIEVFCILEQIKNSHTQLEKVIRSSSKIEAHFQRVAKLPNMAKYLKADRAATTMVVKLPEAKSKRSHKLTYFAARGRAEHIRMIFAAGGVKLDDVQIEQKDWPALKPNTPMGFLPVLEIDGKEKLSQNSTIARYAARECGLAGDNAFDQGLADSVADSAMDLRESGLIPIVFGDDKAAKLEKLATETVPTRLGQLEAVLGKQDFFVNNKLSYADIEVFCVMEQLKNAHAQLAEVVAKSSKLSAHFDRISKLPAMASYLKARETPAALVISL